MYNHLHYKFPFNLSTFLILYLLLLARCGQGTLRDRRGVVVSQGLWRADRLVLADAESEGALSRSVLKEENDNDEDPGQGHGPSLAELEASVAQWKAQVSTALAQSEPPCTGSVSASSSARDQKLDAILPPVPPIDENVSVN